MLLLPLALLMAGAAPAPAPDRPLVAIIDSGIARTAELKDLLVREDDKGVETGASGVQAALQPPNDGGDDSGPRREAEPPDRVGSMIPLGAPARAIHRASPMRRP